MILHARPAPSLRDTIRYYYQVDDRWAAATALQPVPARSPQLLEFTFGTPYEAHCVDRGHVKTACTVALVGAQTYRRVDLVVRGRVDVFTIVFQPGGLSRLFALPAVEITNADVDGTAVLGRSVRDFQQRLGELASFADRVRCADEYLCATLQAGESRDAIIKAAVAILDRDGRVRISQLVNLAGLSVRQFERRFHHAIGMPPKTYARIVRFEAALRQKAVGPDVRWTDIAHDLGYHDQMHMVHDFNRLSGASPSAIAGQLEMFVQPEVTLARHDSGFVCHE